MNVKISWATICCWPGQFRVTGVRPVALSGRPGVQTWQTAEIRNRDDEIIEFFATNEQLS